MEEGLSSIMESSQVFSDEFKFNLLKYLVGHCTMYGWILNTVKERYDSDIYSEFDNLIFKQGNNEEYFKVWVSNIGKIVPENYLLKYFNDDPLRYKDIADWIREDIISKELLSILLLSKLSTVQKIENRIYFHSLLNTIQAVISIEPSNISKIENFKNEFYSIILWYLGKTDILNYDFLKGKFIYFKPDQQVQIIKRLFFLKAEKKIDLSIKKLDELVRADLDLYLTNEKFNPEVVLDLSTSIVIESIKKYSEFGKFLVEGELLSIVLKEIGLDKTRRFYLADYFDKCPGRMKGKYNWKTNGEIQKVPFGEDNYYFAISFSTGEMKTGYNRRSSYEYFESNPKFDELKENIKKISVRKWNKEKKHWGVPKRLMNEVIEFAKENHFLFSFPGDRFENNTHLVEYKRDVRPNGITFCEGKEAQDIHKRYKKKFWWCSNQPCFQNAENSNKITDWKNLTLLNFLIILGLCVEEKGNYGTFDLGQYNKFISILNRFNQLLEKIYCRKCNQILYPIESSNYAAHYAVRFCCENKNCEEYKKTIYLNHCLNGKCNAIIDSRDSKQCPNHLYICSLCGSCCSHSMFIRRIETLKTVGGKVPDDLKAKVNEKSGHLEKAEYYCYSCGKMMPEIEVETFQCSDCNIIYETEKYKLDRSHKFLRRHDYPISRDGNNDDFDGLIKKS